MLLLSCIHSTWENIMRENRASLIVGCISWSATYRKVEINNRYCNIGRSDKPHCTYCTKPTWDVIGMQRIVRLKNASGPRLNSLAAAHNVCPVMCKIVLNISSLWKRDIIRISNKITMRNEWERILSRNTRM